MQPLFIFDKNSELRGKVLYFILYKLHSDDVIPSSEDNSKVWKPIYKSEIKSSEIIKEETRIKFNNLSLLVSDICG
jgi:hypothetical protein